MCFVSGKSLSIELRISPSGPLSARPLGHTFRRGCTPWPKYPKAKPRITGKSHREKDHNIITGWGPPQWCECWFINHEIIPMNTSSLMFVISTINHGFFSHKNVYQRFTLSNMPGGPTLAGKPRKFHRTFHLLDKSLIRHGFQVGKTPPAMGFCQSLVGNCQISMGYSMGSTAWQNDAVDFKDSNLNQKKNTWRIRLVLVYIWVI